MFHCYVSLPEGNWGNNQPHLVDEYHPPPKNGVKETWPHVLKDGRNFGG